MHLNSAQIEQASIIWVLVADGGRAQIYRYHQHKASMPIHDSKREPYEQEVKRHQLTPVNDMKFEAESLNDFHVGHDGRGSKSAARVRGIIPANHISIFTTKLNRISLKKLRIN